MQLYLVVLVSRLLHRDHKSLLSDEQLSFSHKQIGLAAEVVKLQRTIMQLGGLLQITIKYLIQNGGDISGSHNVYVRSDWEQLVFLASLASNLYALDMTFRDEAPGRITLFGDHHAPLFTHAWSSGVTVSRGGSLRPGITKANNSEM